MNAIVPAALAADTELLHISSPHACRLAVVAGVLEDIEREDEDNGQDGYEDAEDSVFWGIVRAARRDVCPVCEFFRCRCLGGAAPAGAVVVVPVGASGQCDICGAWLDGWNGGTCGACKQNGY